MAKNRKSIRQRYRDLSFKKFFIVSLCMFLFPALVLQIIYIRVSISQMNRHLNEQVIDNLQQVSEKFL